MVIFLSVIAAVNIASLLAALILVPDVWVQCLFVLGVGPYLFFLFRHLLTRRRMRKYGDDMDGGTWPHRSPLVDMIAIGCGVGLIYFGFNSPFFQEAAKLFPDYPQPSVDIECLAIGIVLAGFGAFRVLRLRERGQRD